MSIEEVLAGERRFWVEQSDALDFLRTLPDRSVSLALSSPPYEAARTYGVGFKRIGQDWVDWLAPIIVEACRACSGLVFLNAAGQVRDRKYSPVVEWLVADLTRLHGIVCGPAPYMYFRHGVPGSGGDQYHRRDHEPIYAFAMPDRLPLAWSDNTSMGHKPKWAPGGEMSNRLTNGSRRSAMGGGMGGKRRAPSGEMQDFTGKNMQAVRIGGEPDTTPGMFGPLDPEPTGPNVNQWGIPISEKSGSTRKQDGTRQPPGRPSHRKVARTITDRDRAGDNDVMREQNYTVPVLANPGSVIREKYDAEQVRQLLMGGDIGGPVMQGSPGGDVIRALVGGGHMGSKKAHQSEAPFSEVLCEYLIRSFAAPGSVVCDFFAGSGSVGAVSVRWGRRFVGVDLRQSQVDIANERCAGETPPLPGMEDAP